MFEQVIAIAMSEARGILTIVLQNFQKITISIGLVAAAVCAAMVCDFLFFRVLKGIRKRTTISFIESIEKHLHTPVRGLLITLAVSFVLPSLYIPERATTLAKPMVSWFVIGFVAMIVARSLSVLEDFIISRFQPGIKDSLRARRLQTQLSMVKRVVIMVLGILAAALILMTFNEGARLGKTILASAGIVSVVVGMAAQKTIGAFIAGLHLAISGPICIDDTVIVEGEFGKVEEITLTYVVVKLWDMRRMVLPITYFIEKPFQNLSRGSREMIGTVEVFADYTMPVEEVRAELERIVKGFCDGDCKSGGIQVTDSNDKSIKLRAVLTADSDKLWDLRCEVREKLVQFINEKYPHSLPKVRSEPVKMN